MNYIGSKYSLLDCIGDSIDKAIDSISTDVLPSPIINLKPT
jgi:hypothetical protein